MALPKPTIAERAREKVCPECGGPAERKSPKGPAPTFCSPKCKRDHGNRNIVRGRAMVALAMAWRIDRGTGEIAKTAFDQMNRTLDQFNAEDKAAGRPRADLYAAKLMADGTQFFDRQHAVNAAKARAKAERDATTTTTGETA